MVRSCLPSCYAAENHGTGNSEVEGGRHLRGRSRKSWMDNIKGWTGQSLSLLLRIADDRSQWTTITAEAPVGVPQRRPGVAGIS